ncbi:hypothetical protein [cf. Phormidesmis sp. LEGE 11477]|uniref:hypothetical protein n=1 Tax=cf. Phormidesmis sp. LEGE 11477 TaxID=1828680 RepID=UPI001D147EF3|nr:hypothetical protein [cf. Phormidesmis sp. LEGE 11477]
MYNIRVCTMRSRTVAEQSQHLGEDAKLLGFPEYILAKRSPLGKVVFDKPYFLLVEAKQDNFEAAWAQCLAEMIAAQAINSAPELVIYGIASNGSTWQFGKLEKTTFTKSPRPSSIYELDNLFAAVNFVFQACEQKLMSLAAT